MALGLRRVLPDDADGLRESDVVPRFPIDLVGGVEILVDQLPASGQAVAGTHGGTPERPL